MSPTRTPYESELERQLLVARDRISNLEKLVRTQDNGVCSGCGEKTPAYCGFCQDGADI